MSEQLRIFLQYAGNILGAGFVVVVAFAQLADYFSDRKARHLVATLAWLMLVPVFILRTAGIPEPPLLDEQIIADYAAIGWALTLLLGMTWGVLLLVEKRHEAAARYKLGLNAPEKESES